MIKDRARQVPQSSKEVRVRCVNCRVMLTTLDGIQVAAHNKSWFTATVADILFWLRRGFSFDFEDADDAELVRGLL